MNPPPTHLHGVDLSVYLHMALDACREASAVLTDRFRSTSQGVEQKPDGTLVCDADLRAEEVIRASLSGATPEFGLSGEEFGSEGHPRDRWVIDPLDGTHAYLEGLPHFATLIALELGGEPVVGVVHAPLQCPAGSSGVGGSSGGRERHAQGGTWWGVQGEGAFVACGLEGWPGKPRRLSVRHAISIDQSVLAHGELSLFKRLGLWQGFDSVVDSARRTRGFGDWWGHMLVAEGLVDAMVDPCVAWHDVAALVPILSEAGGEMHLSHARPTQWGSRTAVSGNGPLAAAIARRLGTDDVSLGAPDLPWLHRARRGA